MNRYRLPIYSSFMLVVTIVLLKAITPVSNTHTVLAPTSLVVTAPGANGVVLPELDEFATTVIGDPWDMNEPGDVVFFRMGINNAAFSDGIFSGQMAAGDGSVAIRLLSAGTPNHQAMRVGKIGYNYPIDANHYRWLTFRMYSGDSLASSGYVQWFVDDTYTNGGRSQFFPVPANGWTTYVIDLADSVPAGVWSGIVRELMIHPMGGAGVQGATVKLDWARLAASDPRTARPYVIQWTGTGDGGPVSLYASVNDKVLDANDILIASGLNASGGSYTFQTGILPPGAYYIAAKNNSGTAWSGGPLIIHAPPQMVITKPSMTSGQEYSATEIGNPWDMSDAADVNYQQPMTNTCLTGESFVNGIYSAAVSNICVPGATHADPKMYFGGLDRNPPGTLDPIIDTQRYRYLSYRFYHSGEQAVSQGGLTRLFWYQIGSNGSVVEPPVTGRDVVIQEGWNVYSLDLWAPDAVDETVVGLPVWSSSHPNRLRFDPDEINVALLPVNVQFDWIKLTAMDQVQSGEGFPIGFKLNADQPVTLTFYYDTDTNPANGRTQIGRVSPPTPASLSAVSAVRPIPAAVNLDHKAYFPLILRNWCTGNCYMWNVTGVAPGLYYICINAQDAYNAAYRCSPAPVIVN